MTKKRPLANVECLMKFQGILIGYKMKLFSDHENLVYDATLSEYQRVMRWKLIIEEFGPNIQYIYGFDNMLADILSRFLSMISNKYDICTRKAQFHVNKLFGICRVKNNGYRFPLNLLIVQIEQQKELRNTNLQTQYINFGSRTWLLQTSS